MPSEDFERRIQQEMRSLPIPEGLEERVAAMAREQVSGLAPRRRPRRNRLFVMIATGVLLAGAGSAAAWFLANDDGNAIPAGPEARAAISESGVLASAPWIIQPGTSGTHIQDVAPGASLQYPAGTSYPEAVDQLVRSVIERGLLPGGTELSGPLPGTVVWEAGAAASGPRLDLRAPLGYEIPSGIVRTPSFSFSAGAAPAKVSEALRALVNRRITGKPLGSSIRVDTPALAPCQILALGETNRPCRLVPTRTGE